MARKQRFTSTSADIGLHRDSAITSRVYAGLFTAIVLAGALGGWAAGAEISGAVVASGVVKVDRDLRAIQHLDGGIVREIEVQKGDDVTKDQLLFRLDDTQTRAELQIVTTQLQELIARQARLLAERDNLADLEVPQDIPGIDIAGSAAFRGEQRLFLGNLETRRSQKEQLSLSITQNEQETKALLAQKDANARERKMVEAELAKLEPLRKQGLIDNSRIFSNTRDLTRLTGEAGTLAANIDKALARKNELQVNLAAIDSTAHTEAQKQLSEITPQINELKQRQAAVADRLSRSEIRSPIDGIVNDIAVNTIGGVITPAQKLLTIVPASAKLQVEVKLATNDIDQVFVGQTARVRFSAFSSRSTPELYGEIAFVSPATTSDENSGQAYYIAQVDIPGTELAKLDGKKLLPGMPVETYVETESRTALSYLVKPFADQFVKAFREQ